MNAGSLNLGRYAGIPVRAHWSMAFIAALIGLNWSTNLGVVAGVLATIVFFGSILAHEFGHALVARRFGVNTESIDLWALGGVARLDREPPTPRADGLIAIAGPAVSAVLAIAFIGSGLALSSDLLFGIGFLNALLAVFNMLPGAPLDGGRVVRAIRWARTGDKYRAMRDAGQAGRLLGWSINIFAVWLVFIGLIPVFFALLLIASGLFIALNARAEIMAAFLRQQLDGVKVRDLTWFGIAQAGADMDADSMLWQRQRLGNAGAVAVVGDDGALDGLVLEDQMWAVPAERRGMVMLTQLMTPFSKTARATPDEELTAVLPRLNPLRPVVTVWNDDEQLTGVVPPSKLQERLTKAQQAAFSS